MKSISGKQLCKIVEQKGWYLRRVTGSHHIYDNSQYGSDKPPNLQFWGSKIDRSPPELGDLGGDPH